MSDSRILRKLAEWYSEQCDGRWEHGPGIRIDTIDNPGWLVRIKLHGSASEGVVVENVNVDRGESDWLRCSKKDGEFVGAGDPSKLPAILAHFLKSVGKV